MDDAYEFSRFFPDDGGESTLNEYIGHHSASIKGCLENNLFSSAYSHLHLLYMVFIYVQLLRIAQEKKQEFEYGWIGFPSQEKDFLKNPESPFSFSGVNERSVFRFFRLVGFNDADISRMAKLIDVRNDRMHAKGRVHCRIEEEFTKDIKGYLTCMKLVISKQNEFLENIYGGLVVTYEPGYEFKIDDLKVNYAGQYLFSEYELSMLASGKSDVASTFIREYYGES